MLRKKIVLPGVRRLHAAVVAVAGSDCCLSVAAAVFPVLADVTPVLRCGPGAPCCAPTVDGSVPVKLFHVHKNLS